MRHPEIHNGTCVITLAYILQVVNMALCQIIIGLQYEISTHTRDSAWLILDFDEMGCRCENNPSELIMQDLGKIYTLT